MVHNCPGATKGLPRSKKGSADRILVLQQLVEIQRQRIRELEREVEDRDVLLEQHGATL